MSVSVITVMTISLTLEAYSEIYASHCEENSLYLAICSSSRPRRGRLYLSSLNAAFRLPMYVDQVFWELCGIRSSEIG